MFARKLTTGLAIVSLAGMVSCTDLQSPNVNSSDLADLTENPTRTKIANALTGLLAGNRSYMAGGFDYVIMTGVLGRNAYRLDIAEPRTITEWLEGELNPGSERGGGNIWARPYENIRLSQIVLDAIAAAPTTELTEGEKAAARGLAKTSRTLDLLMIVNTRDFNCDGDRGCPVEVSEDPRELAPAVTKREVFDEIVRLLDEARSDLESAAAAGAGFVVSLPSGFQDFQTPSAFVELNRALAARVLTYMGREFDPSFWDQALTALEGSFLDEGASMELGAFYNYSAGSGDQENELFEPGSNPNARAHPSVRTDVELKPSGEPDERFQRKIRDIEFRQLRGVGSDIGFDIYRSPSAPVPIIRNEELILLRAEANIGLGNLEAARSDINLVRQVSGGLPPVDEFASQDEALDQLLYEKRYSLLFEGGHRWIDLRRWDRLEELPLDQPDHVRNAAFPVPLSETIAR